MIHWESKATANSLNVTQFKYFAQCVLLCTRYELYEGFEHNCRLLSSWHSVKVKACNNGKVKRLNLKCQVNMVNHCMAYIKVCEIIRWQKTFENFTILLTCFSKSYYKASTRWRLYDDEGPRRHNWIQHANDMCKN